MIAVANGKGGVGKTTSSVYLASASRLAHPEASVVLFDLDPQRSASEWASLAENAGDPLPFDVIRGSLQKLQSLQNYDFVIVDTAPAISDASLRTLCELSDLVVIPTEAEGLGLAKTYATEEICEPKGVVLLTRARPRTRIFTEAVSALDDAGVVRFEAVISDSVRYKSYGITPTTVGDYGAVWQEIEEEIR